MRAPVSWLREHVEIPEGTTGEQIAAALVRVGLEEEGLHGGDVQGPLVVGRVLEMTPEPQKNGKTINWCQVDVGSANGTGEPQGIVCGAHNFAVGDTVACILPGGVLPGDFHISARKTYGHVSSGMICSARELGLGEDHDGIIVLERWLGADQAAALEPGTDLIPVLGLDAETVEVNVTPDRGYCFSMRGIAREYAHSTGARYTDPVSTIVLDDAARAGSSTPTATSVGVELADERPIHDRPGCDRYIARLVTGIDASAATPAVMQQQLTDAGMRPISIAVDVTNHVMLDLGQPLHAFDLGKLRSVAGLGQDALPTIVVRRAEPGETLTTLDDVTRTLDPEDLLITVRTDDGRTVPVAIAGVMGGASTEVDEATTDVVLESAHFDAVSVARSARRHRLPSEASKRYERGVDPQLAPAAAQRAVDLLVEHAGGTAGAVREVDESVSPEPFSFDTARPTRLVGVEYTRDEVIAVLREIGCEVVDGVDAPGTTPDASGHGTVQVTPPPWRPDLRTGPDLVEEVARLRGYDAIPSVLPQAPGGRGLTTSQRRRGIVAELLAGAGLHEVLSYPFTSERTFDELGYGADDVRRRAVRLANPLSDEAPLMRTSLLQTTLDVARRNLARGQRDVAIFEVGLVTRPSGDEPAAFVGPVGVRPSDEDLAALRASVPAQPRRVAGVLAGEWDRSGWWGAGRRAEWSDAVELVRLLADRLGVPVELHSDDMAPWHPGRCAVVTLAESEHLAAAADGVQPGQVIGHAGELHPKVTKALGLPERTVAFEVTLDSLLAATPESAQVRTLVSQPVALSDIALVVGEGTTAADLEATLREGAGDLLESVTLFDTYAGDQLGEGQRSLAWRLQFRAPDRTLTTAEVNAARDAAISLAAERHGATQRV